MTNKTRYIPQDFKPYTPDLGDYPKDLFACYMSLDVLGNGPAAIFYVGKQSKPLFYNRFRTVDDLKKKVNDTIKRLMSHADMIARRKADRIAKRKAMDVSTVKAGDIYHRTYGYNCTKNEYARITGSAGKNKFHAVILNKYQVDGDWMNGNVAPVLDTGHKDVILHAHPGYSGTVELKDPKGYRAYYTLWNGKPNWENCD